MNLADEIRQQIEKNRDLKLEIGEINNHLSILEGLLRNERDDAQKQVNEAYQRGLEDGKKAFDLLDAERDSEYQRGLNDAWEAARKIVTWPDRSLVNSDSFDLDPGENIFTKYSASEAITKLKAYEEKQKAYDEIKVGDEVVWTEDEDTVIIVTIIYTSSGIEWCDGICRDGKVYQIITEHARKTGRHFDIDKILEEMKE